MNNDIFNALKQAILELSVVKEYRRYYQIIKEDKNLYEQLEELHYVEKELVNAKEFGLSNALLQYQEKYENLLNSLNSNPLMANFLSLKEEVNSLLSMVTEIIEEDINKNL